MALNISYLPPSDQLGQKITELFSYPWKAIEKSSDQGATWYTLKGYPLRPRTLWAKYCDPLVQIGVRYGKTTAYGLLDIDQGSPYLSPQEIRKIQNALETIGITETLIIRSSHSGGVHLYYPLPYAIATFDLACSVRHCLQSAGFIFAAGSLEAFPNTKSYAVAALNQFSEYNGHRLPLQAGSDSCLLDSELNPRGDSLERFLWEWDNAANRQDMELLIAALPAGRAANWPKRKRKSSPTEQWRADLERDIKAGFTGQGQTNSFIKACGCYCRVFMGLSGEALREQIEPMVVMAPGFETYCRHQDEIEIRIAAWARSIEAYYWPLGTERARTIDRLDVNLERAKEAVARISAAVRRLAAAGELAAGIRARRDQLIAAARTSAQTLQKNLALWHPTGWCVPTLIPTVTGDPAAPPPPPGEWLKPLPSGLVHTFKNIMKCLAPEIPPFKEFPPGEGGLQGGSGCPLV